MSKKIFKIFILSILLIMISNIKSFGVVSKDINKQITNWTSGGFTGWTDDLKKQEFQKILNNLKKQEFQKILNNLKNDFQYTGKTINNEMKMKTTISIVDKSKVWYSNLPFVEDKYEYTIRIRNR